MLVPVVVARSATANSGEQWARNGPSGWGAGRLILVLDCPAVAPLRSLLRPARLGDLPARHDQNNDHPDQPEPADADPQAKTAPVLSDERVGDPPCQPHDERNNRHNNTLPRYSAQATASP